MCAAAVVGRSIPLRMSGRKLLTKADFQSKLFLYDIFDVDVLCTKYDTTSFPKQVPTYVMKVLLKTNLIGLLKEKLC